MYAADPILGHASHLLPQAFPIEEQQHKSLLNSPSIALVHFPCLYLVKHCSSRMSKHCVPIQKSMCLHRNELILNLLTSVVQRQSRRTRTSKTTICVDASTTAPTNIRIQVALVNIGASFSVGLRVTSRALALVPVATLARRSPRHSDGAAAFCSSAELGQVVLAPAVVEFGPAGAFSVI